ncbi:MAG TPA: hypothetical protein VKV37_17785 [Ktedonobacteraceae bacterium]|jgi:hypothetical protein|nr:hypothetical protein [Ktedonobacteraceae bacterium]
MNLSKKSLHAFATLHWYEECIKFLFTFTAKTSELLLAAGLVVSTANFLTDGNVMGKNTSLAYAWAWAQALAIDSSLGITFYAIFHCIKQRDWLKAILYGLLTLLLAIVAGTITNVDTFSHALHLSISGAMSQVGLDVKILTTLRAVAVVGFVMMSRLKDVSFKELYQPEAQPCSAASPQATAPNNTVVANQDASANDVARILSLYLSPEALTQLAQALTQRGATTVTEETGAQELPLLVSTTAASAASPATRTEQETDAADEESQEARLSRAYQELQAAGQRISGRALAKQAHVHRVTCNQWLRERHPASSEAG